MADVQHKKNLTYSLIGMAFWNLIVAIDSTALGIALPTISRDVNATTNQAFWCGTSFILCSAASQPIIASFSNVFGRRKMLVLSLLLFTIGGIICGVAHNITILLLGRSIQGWGAGGLLTLTYVIMADELTLQERHKAISVMSLAWLVGTVLGPVMSGALTQHATWRWIFWINMPFCAICLILVTFFITSSYKAQQSTLQGLRQIDWIGSFIFVSSLSSFLIAISMGGVMYPWSSWHTIVPLTLGLAGIMLWIAHSMWLAKEPLIPLRIMNNRTAAISYFGTVICGLIQFGIVYYLPIYYQLVLDYSPTISGVALVPNCLCAGLFSAITGLLISKYNTIKPFVIGGWVIYSLGLGLLTLLKPGTTTVQWIFLNLPSGIGLGALIASLVLATQAAAEVSDVRSAAEILKIKAVASSLNPFFRALGQALGIVIAQAAFTNELKKHLGSTIAQDAAKLSQELHLLPAAERTIYASAFDDSLRVVWWVLLGLSAMMLCLTFLTKDIGIRPKSTLPTTKLPAMSDFCLSPISSRSRSPAPASTLALNDIESCPNESKDVLQLSKAGIMVSAKSYDTLSSGKSGDSGVASPVSRPPSRG